MLATLRYRSPRSDLRVVVPLIVPTLQGRRLRLEPLSSAHSPGMFELWRQPEVCEHSGPAVDSQGQNVHLPARSPRDSDRLLRYWIDRCRAGTGFRWAAVLHTPSRFVGAVGFNSLSACSEYAYHFVPKYWGAGLAREASLIALSWSFSVGSESVEAFIEPANSRSVRLAKRLGFERADHPTGGPVRYVVTREHAEATTGGSVARHPDPQ